MGLNGNLYTIIEDLETHNFLEEASHNYMYPVSCTKDFLNKFYDGDVNKWMEDNKTNRNCFNCIGCKNCSNCKGCASCIDCYCCLNCVNCVKCECINDEEGLKNKREWMDEKKYKQPFICKLSSN